MTDIDELLSEAKPLYVRRKKERRAIFSFLSLGVCAAFSLLMFQTQTPSGAICDVWTDEIYQAENGSVIEDMGLPTDDYGLLLVG